MGFLIFLIIVGGLGFTGWTIFTNKKNETFSVPENFVINTKPTMPAGTQTSFFLTKTKELTNKSFEKIGEFSIQNFPFKNYFIAFFSGEKNVFLILGQNIPDSFQKFLGITEKPFMSVISLFTDGSDLETTTRENSDKEIKSEFRRVIKVENLPLELMINKHKESVDKIEVKGIHEVLLNKDDFFKYFERGLRIDVAHRLTRGYVTKADVEEILKKLQLKLTEVGKKEQE
ncbi:MAG: hypothetical protein QME48_00590 [bacterium]|nr:hypothetical protein [bacterium]